MRFSLRSMLEVTAAVAVALSLFTTARFWHRVGRQEVLDEFQHTGKVATHTVGIIVPLDDNINLHVIKGWKPKPGKAIVEVWDCSTNWNPKHIRSADVDITRP